MHDKKDIADLLEEVQSIVHTLRDEKIALRDQVSGLEAQIVFGEGRESKRESEFTGYQCTIEARTAGYESSTRTRVTRHSTKA